MATKYAGQNTLNKLMQLVKSALANKADKTNATTSAAGLLSAADKTKLDGIGTGANKTVVDTALSATSTNPVQNKAVKAALDAKAEKTELDGKLGVTGGTIFGDLKVKTNAEGTGNIEVEGEIRAKTGNALLHNVFATGGVHSDLDVESQMFILRAPLGEKSVRVEQDGDTAVKMECFNGTLSAGYARLEVGTPTGDNDATTKAYVDSKIAAGGVTVDSAMSASSTNPVQNKAVKSYVDTKVSGLQTADQVQAAISSAITGVYTPKGSIAFKSLPTAAAGNKGWVYNITDAFTTTAAFVEGAGHSYGAGTNVVCVAAGGGSYKWDVLAGTIDLTELTAAEVQTLWDSI